MNKESKALGIIITIAYAFFILSAVIGKLIFDGALIAMGIAGSIAITLVLVSSFLIPDEESLKP